MGYSENKIKNAVNDSKKPHIDYLYNNYPFTTLEPGGEAVGLPKGVAGNSEVGHLNLGSGRAVRQDLVRINEAISNNTLSSMDKFKELLKVTRENSKRLHLMGLLSDGGVHSHINHLKAILKILEGEKDIKVYFHAFMDGRDTPTTNGIKYIEDLLNFKNFTFASMQGRSIGMDRDRRWEKIELAYKTFIGDGKKTTLTPTDYIKSQYEKNVFDEFIEPTLFSEDSKIEENDSVFFINFRPDRAKEITTAFCSKNFPHFENKIRPKYFLCMSPYVDEELPEVPILFDKEKLKGTLAEYISSLGLKQFKIAETEKYAHVTYFFNGGEEKPFPHEERLLINSPKDVKTYDERPTMSGPKVLEELLKKLSDKSINLYVCNFANPDMVGHTGNYEAAIKAIEFIDSSLKALEEKCIEEDVAMLITADHGNADQMSYEDGTPHTSHTTSLVPFVLVHKDLKNEKLNILSEGRALKDVAPTILHLLGINSPESFTGKTIFY